MSDDLDKILDELKNDDSVSSLNETASAEKLDINDENVNDYIMQKVGKLIESGIETVETIQQTIASGFEPEELQAFSGLIASVMYRPFLWLLFDKSEDLCHNSLHLKIL